MRSSTLPRGSFDGGWPLVSLWAGLVTGPLAWAALLEVNYVLSYVSCESHWSWMLHAATVTALVLIATSAMAVSRVWVQAIREGAEGAARADRARARAMALGGIAMCAWFALVVVATEVPVIVLQPCTP